jgi:hypothetical protein
MKAIKSILDPYEDELMAMDEEKKTIVEMVEWLKGKGLEPDRSTVSRFLTSRRIARENAEMLGDIHGTSGQVKAADEAWKENPAPALEKLIRLHRVTIWKLIFGKKSNDMISLGNRLTNTVIQHVNNKTKARFKGREVRLAEAKADEAKKSDQEKALEICLAECKGNPEAVEMFTSAFEALESKDNSAAGI